MINLEELKKLAHLARIKFPDGELVNMQKDIERILGMLQKLQEVPTENIEPLVNVMESQSLPFRKDEVTDENKAKEVLINAPGRENYQNIDCYIVPKVVE